MKKYFAGPVSKVTRWLNPKNFPPVVSNTMRALVLFAAFFALTEETRFWRGLEFRGFDLLSKVTAAGESNLPIIVVGIDDASVAELDLRWPWPRSLHAKLIDTLVADGAAVVAFDVVFNSASTPEDDAALEKSIANAGNVVLIASAAKQDTPQGTIWTRLDPFDAFIRAGAKVGLAQIEFEPDLVVRRFPLAADAFWKEILFRLRAANPGVDFDSTLKDDRLIRYFGPDRSVPYVSYARVLGRGEEVPKGTFDGALVLVGRATAAVADVGSAQVDVFATPFTAFNGRLTPGIEIHANMIDNAVNRASIGEVHPWVRGFLLMMVSVWCAFVPGRFRLLPSAMSAMFICSAMAGLSYALFVGVNLWLPVIGVMTLAFTSFLIQALQAYSDELRQKSRIRAAFSLFVPLAVADRLAAQSTMLEPGGEEVELTSLFTDLAGFTSISEGLKPAQVAQLLNLYFDSMTEIVFRHGGTVQGYIGDALFAFWGAPVLDPDHRIHAAKAAREMVAAKEGINAKLNDKGLPGVHTRIGVHSGSAIVGNIGSKVRFNYTALGDTINLSARLEGLNKRYGTSLLISSETYLGIPQRSGFRRVERVRVKGRDKPVEVFTPCDDVRTIETNDHAIDLYLARKWAASKELWRSILEHDAADPVAIYYLEHIAELEQSVVGDDWDGVESIHEK